MYLSQYINIVYRDSITVHIKHIQIGEYFLLYEMYLHLLSSEIEIYNISLVILPAKKFFKQIVPVQYHKSHSVYDLTKRIMFSHRTSRLLSEKV